MRVEERGLHAGKIRLPCAPMVEEFPFSIEPPPSFVPRQTKGQPDDVRRFIDDLARRLLTGRDDLYGPQKPPSKITLPVVGPTGSKSPAPHKESEQQRKDEDYAAESERLREKQERDRQIHGIKKDKKKNRARHGY